MSHPHPPTRPAETARLDLGPAPAEMAVRLGAAPAGVSRPAAEADVVEVLAACVEAGRPCVPWGAGTHQSLGPPPPASAVVCHLSALDGVSEHRAADLVVSVRAGTPLAALQDALARVGQCVPADPPRYFPGEPTIGGLVAARLDGPNRLGHGGWRDRVIGLRVAVPRLRGAPGGPAAQVLRTGAKVVKNVAGYDVTKLHVGGLGALGIITEVTLKVAPLPPARQTARVAAPDLGAAARLLAALGRSELGPAAAEALSPALDAACWPGGESAGAVVGGAVVWVAFEDVPANVRYQVDRLRILAREAGCTVPEVAGGDAAAGAWTALAECWADASWTLVVRAIGPPAAAAPALAALEDAAAAAGHRARGSAGAHGHALVALAPDTGPGPPVPAPGPDLVAALRRAALGAGAVLTLERAPTELRRPQWAWPPAGPERSLARKIKDALDPAGILNPGRLPGGI